jgi:GNAT superfamily N-acetyltransferase
MTLLPQGYRLTEDQAEIDAVAAHAYLTTSYWAKGRTLETVRRAIENSLCVAVLLEGEQVAMARVLSDYATFAYVDDVYVLETHQRKGLAGAMLRYLLDHPRLQGLARWALYTKDAQSLYARYGWMEYPYPDRMMVIDKRFATA